MIKADTKNYMLKIFHFGVFFFFLSFIALILRYTKDALIITSTQDGVLLLSGLKNISFCPRLVFLGLFFLFYRKDNLPRFFYVSLGCFAAFFMIFHFWLYPNASFLHPSVPPIQELIQGYSEASIFLLVYKTWIFCSYYLFADLLGLFVIVFLFWALVNQSFTRQEAKLAYPILFLFPSASSILGSIFFSSLTENISKTMYIVDYLVVFGLLISICCFWIIHKKYLKQVISVEPQVVSEISNKSKLVYLTLIFIIVISYGLCLGLLTTLFKSSLMGHYGSPENYSFFMGQYSFYLGIFTPLIFLLTFWMIYMFGWLKSALVPPLLIFATTLVLIFFNLTPEVGKFFANQLKIEEATFLILLFSSQNILLSGIGFLFLATKEMAYIPLPVTTKARGKGIVDFLFSGLGSWLSGIILTIYLAVSMDSTMKPFEWNLLGFFSFVCVVSLAWAFAVFYLDKIYKKEILGDSV